MAKVSFPSIEDVRSEPPSHDGVSNLGHPRLLSWRGCRTSWSSTPFPKGAVEVVESEVGHHDMDVQRDVLETEVWEVRYHVVVLDLARKAVSLPGDQTPEGLLDFGIDNLHPGLPATFQHLIVHRHSRNSSIERLARAVCRHCISGFCTN